MNLSFVVLKWIRFSSASDKIFSANDEIEFRDALHLTVCWCSLATTRRYFDYFLWRDRINGWISFVMDDCSHDFSHFWFCALFLVRWTNHFGSYESHMNQILIFNLQFFNTISVSYFQLFTTEFIHPWKNVFADECISIIHFRFVSFSINAIIHFRRA